MIESIHRYPRTQHLEGSRLQPGDHDLTQVPLSQLRGLYCEIEEKLDGANPTPRSLVFFWHDTPVSVIPDGQCGLHTQQPTL